MGPLVIDSASPSSEEQSQEGSLSEPGIRRRRLVEAAYFAFTTPPLVIDSASPSTEEQSREASLPEESQEGNLSEPGIRRRRLVEAAYFAFIGFNMLLMCCLLVGISFAYHVGTREANYAPIRW